jgi:hypothetical protein
MEDFPLNCRSIRIKLRRLCLDTRIGTEMIQLGVNTIHAEIGNVKLIGLFGEVGTFPFSESAIYEY